MDSGVTGRTGDLAARHAALGSEQDHVRVPIHRPLTEENNAQAVQTIRNRATQISAPVVSVKCTFNFLVRTKDD